MHAAIEVKKRNGRSLMLNTLQYTHLQSQHILRRRREGKLGYKHRQAKTSKFHCQTSDCRNDWELSFVQFFKQKKNLKIPFYYTPWATVHSFKSQTDFLIYIDSHQATQSFLKSQVSCTVRQGQSTNLPLKYVFHKQQNY